MQTLRHAPSAVRSTVRSAARTSRRNVVSVRMGIFDTLFGAGKSSGMATQKAPTEAPPGQKIATFAGGCFWSVELAFQRTPGVTQTSVGYTDGHKESPSYEEVCSGRTGHTEAVQVYYSPSETSYDKLLDVFFTRTDPTTANRQGNDAGSQYRSGIYYHDDEQKAAALKKIAEVQARLDKGEKIYFREGSVYEGKKVVTEVKPVSDYWIAESYHQQYLEKGGRGGRAQSAAKMCTDPIRCYG